MTGKNLHTIYIEKLVPGGFGLGRLEEGIVVLVRYVLPGEKVLVREVGRKKDYIAAVLTEVLSPSSERIAPPCPVYGSCGGCDLQHAGPETQIRLKKAILTDSLQRAAGNIFADSPDAIEDPLAPPEQFGYRQRIRLQVDAQGSYGFFRPDSHILVPVSECLLGVDSLNKVLRQLPASASFKELLNQCRAFELLFNPSENDTLMLLQFLRKPRPADCLLAKDLTNAINGLSTLLMQVEGYGLYNPIEQRIPTGPPILSFTVTIEELGADLNFSWEAGGFCQVNLQQNINMIKLILEMVAGGPQKRVLDLYCGYGNFSLVLAKLGAEVLGVDSQNAAIRSAQRNAS